MSFHRRFKIRWRPTFNDSAIDKKDSNAPPSRFHIEYKCI